MTDIQEITPDTPLITDSISLGDLRKRLDHLDTMLHGQEQKLADVADDIAAIRQFITRHEPTLARALKLFDNPVTRFTHRDRR